jgi:hypothetical protein
MFGETFILRKIRAHINIHDNDIKDAVAKLAIAYFEDIPAKTKSQSSKDVKKIKVPGYGDGGCNGHKPIKKTKTLFFKAIRFLQRWRLALFVSSSVG